jgi:hypothetical protein
VPPTPASHEPVHEPVREPVTAVEIDAEAKAAADAARLADLATTATPPHEDIRAQTESDEAAAAEEAAAADEAPAPTASAAASVEATLAGPPLVVPLSTAPASLPPPRITSVQTSGPTPACPQCEAPMAWVEEHLRFYCKQCRMYF